MSRFVRARSLAVALSLTGSILGAADANASGYACHASGAAPAAAPGFNWLSVANTVRQGQPLRVDLSLADLGNGLGSVLVDIDGSVRELPIAPDGTTVFTTPPADITCVAVVNRTVELSTDSLAVGSHQLVFHLTDAAGTLASYRQQRVVAVTAPPSPTDPVPTTLAPAPAPAPAPPVPLAPSPGVVSRSAVWFTRIARVRSRLRVVARTAGAGSGARVRLERRRRRRWLPVATRRVARDSRARFTIAGRRVPRHTRIRVVLVNRGAQDATSPSRWSR